MNKVERERLVQEIERKLKGGLSKFMGQRVGEVNIETIKKNVTKAVENIWTKCSIPHPEITNLKVNGTMITFNVSMPVKFVENYPDLAAQILIAHKNAQEER